MRMAAAISRVMALFFGLKGSMDGGMTTILSRGRSFQAYVAREKM